MLNSGKNSVRLRNRTEVQEASRCRQTVDGYASPEATDCKCEAKTPRTATVYTEILDFALKYLEGGLSIFCVDLITGAAALQLTETDGLFGVAVNVYVDDVDSLFKKYKSRGLDVSPKKESPVHQSPLDQSWGRREFYVTDADGNTLRFSAPVSKR